MKEFLITFLALFPWFVFFQWQFVKLGEKLKEHTRATEKRFGIWRGEVERHDGYFKIVAKHVKQLEERFDARESPPESNVIPFKHKDK